VHVPVLVLSEVGPGQESSHVPEAGLVYGTGVESAIAAGPAVAVAVAVAEPEPESAEAEAEAEPVEVESAEAEVEPAEIAPAEVAPAEVAPAEVAPAEATIAEAGFAVERESGPEQDRELAPVVHTAAPHTIPHTPPAAFALAPAVAETWHIPVAAAVAAETHYIPVLAPVAAVAGGPHTLDMHQAHDQGMQRRASGMERIETVAQGAAGRTRPIRRAVGGCRLGYCVLLRLGGIAIGFGVGVGHGRVQIGHILRMGVSY
jgi:hypothetical protein